MRASTSNTEARYGRPVFQLPILEFRLSNLAFLVSLGKGNDPACRTASLDKSSIKTLRFGARDESSLLKSPFCPNFVELQEPS